MKMTTQTKKTISEALVECLKLFICLGWITAMLWISATSFDATELKALGGIAAGLGGAKVVSLLSNGKNQ